MTTTFVRNAYDRDKLFKLLLDRKMPFTVNVTQGVNRSIEQNNLAFKWYQEIAHYLDDRDSVEVRAECKLHHGVPIMRTECEVFRSKYDEYIKPLPYEKKLELMVEPVAFPVTSLMNTRQMKRYLDIVYRKFTEKGVTLTVPEDPYYRFLMERVAA